MRAVESFEEIQQYVAGIRSLKLGVITNFFADPVKHSLWIKKGDCFIEQVNNTLFILKKSLSFWNVFYCSTTLEAFGNDLEEFQAKYSKKTMMFDIVGREKQCQPLVELFKAKGCKEATKLVRMTKMTEPMDYKQCDAVRYACKKDLPLVSRYLHTYFDEQTEQIPYDEELVDYAKRGHVLICEEEGQMAGFLIFELNATTLYLRYWFTHPDYRDRKVGSRLMSRFFEEGVRTKRQLFWVILSNDNAIRRYKHYGFYEENMYDFVMQYN